jgi:hypothetical protein
MVLRFWGERAVSAETFAPLVDRSAAGIRTTALVEALADRGWRATGVAGTDSLIAGELSSGRPVIALIEDRPHVFHYIVIVGLTERAVIFHDPARAPLRVMVRDEFVRRWRAADRWMAIVLPASSAEAAVSSSRGPDESRPTPSEDLRPAPPDTRRPASLSIDAASSLAARSCDARVSDGISEAQANNLEAAERTLTAALGCPGAAAARELAGVRFLQQRWDDAAQLASQAAAADPADTYAWQLLGTSRFLLDQPLAALDAWNRAGQPTLDLVRVDGLERTRQRPVERLIGIDASTVITRDGFVRGGRALTELPSARSTRLELVPAREGLAELHASIAERAAVPRDAPTWAVTAARAAVARTVGLSLGSLTGAGESVGVEWRFWPHRPRLAVSLHVPAPWPGIWGADVYGESQEFDQGNPKSTRRGGRLVVSRWVSSLTRLEIRAGADRWNTSGTFGAVGVSAGFMSPAERLSARLALDTWAGSESFGSFAATLALSSAPRQALSRSVPMGPVMTFAGGFSVVTDAAPLDLWPAGDVGQARTILARAHPLLDDGRMQASRLGRAAAFGTGEAQYWWKAPGLSRVAASAFVDLVRTMNRASELAAVNDVDVGTGITVASLLVPGRLRVDYAHGLRDGADAVTARYVVSPW